MNRNETKRNEITRKKRLKRIESARSKPSKRQSTELRDAETRLSAGGLNFSTVPSGPKAAECSSERLEKARHVCACAVHGGLPWVCLLSNERAFSVLIVLPECLPGCFSRASSGRSYCHYKSRNNFSKSSQNDPEKIFFQKFPKYS